MAAFMMQNWWIGSILWACLFVSDYILTITGARLYKAQDELLIP